MLFDVGKTREVRASPRKRVKGGVKIKINVLIRKLLTLCFYSKFVFIIITITQNHILKLRKVGTNH